MEASSGTTSLSSTFSGLELNPVATPTSQEAGSCGLNASLEGKAEGFGEHMVVSTRGSPQEQSLQWRGGVRCSRDCGCALRR